MKIELQVERLYNLPFQLLWNDREAPDEIVHSLATSGASNSFFRVYPSRGYLYYICLYMSSLYVSYIPPRAYLYYIGLYNIYVRPISIIYPAKRLSILYMLIYVIQSAKRVTYTLYIEAYIISILYMPMCVRLIYVIHPAKRVSNIFITYSYICHISCIFII